MVKFGQVVDIRAIAEWRQHYLSYEKMKRIMKQIPSSKTEDDVSIAESSPRSSRASRDDSAGMPLMTMSASKLAEIEHSFNEVLDADVVRMNTHVKEQHDKIRKSMEVLLQQNAFSVYKASPTTQSYNASERAVDQQLVTSTYCACARLRSFVLVNHEGIRKIVKKLDKLIGGTPRQPQILKRLSAEPFYTGLSEIEDWMVALEQLCSNAEAVLSMKAEGRKQCAPQAPVSSTPRVWGVVASVLVACAVLLLTPLLDPDGNHEFEKRCACVLLSIITLWLTEALPYFVTSLLVPVLVVLGRVMPAEPEEHTGKHGDVQHDTTDDSGSTPAMEAADAAKMLLSSMFGSPVILLVLAGLVAAAVVSRCQLELRLASALSEWLGRYPLAFMLVIMQLGLATSMCVSNVTAPILLLNVLTPLLREMPGGSRYAKALVLGLAFSCNLGGMLTPIASPQNAVALQALAYRGATIGFGTWFLVALPIAEIGLLLVHGLLLLLLRPFDCAQLPRISIEKKQKLGRRELAMLCCVMATTVLWATLSFPPLHDTFGDPAVVGLALVVGSFGSGFLTKDDFNGLNWHLLALIGGGNALGLAVSKSGLLHLASHSLLKAQLSLGGTSVWLLTAELVGAMLVITSFVSHTVAAIVTMPLIASIGAHAGAPAQIVFCCTLTCSAAMALPMSSFPNVNSLLAEDDYGRAYVNAADFVLVGLPASMLVSALSATLAFWLIGLML